MDVILDDLWNEVSIWDYKEPVDSLTDEQLDELWTELNNLEN